MELSVNEMYELRKAQEMYDGQEKRNFKLSLLLVQNNKVLNGHIKDFEDAQKKMAEQEDVKAYTEERQKMIDSHRIKKTDGSFETTMVEGKLMYRLDKVDALNKKLDVFDKEHEEVIKKLEGNEKEMQEMIDAPVEVKLKCITDKTYVQALDAKTLVALAPIIKVSLTEDLLESKGEELTIHQMERLLQYCEVR